MERDDSIPIAGSEPPSEVAPFPAPPTEGEPAVLAVQAPPPLEAGASETPPAGETPSHELTLLKQAVGEGFAAIMNEFRDKLALDLFKEEQITKLHDELQSYKSDIDSRTTRQILLGVIRLHDDLGRVATSLRQLPAEELTPERLCGQLEGFQDDVELLLGQHSVVRFADSGEEFDPRRQTALRTAPAAAPELVGRIAARLRPGFEQGETVLQKERVAVFAEARS